jgi:anti-anti-sigma regulatory factor
MSASDNLVATVEQRRGGASVIRLAGILDEHNKLGDLVKDVTNEKTLINLAGVERVSSVGTRDWVNWLASLERKGIRPVLVACSPAVVKQLNLVKNFAGNATVKSVQVPYHCAPCDKAKTLLVNIDDLGPRPYRAPRCTCDVCGISLTFVDDTGAYFSFVAQVRASQKAISVPALAQGTGAGDTQPPQNRTSEPRLTRESSPYLSAFQVAGRKSPSQPRMALDRPSQQNLRPSQRDIQKPPTKSAERPYLLAILALLLCTVLVLLFLFVTR